MREGTQDEWSVGQLLGTRIRRRQVLDRDRHPEPLGPPREPGKGASLGEQPVLARRVVDEGVAVVHDVARPDLDGVSQQSLEGAIARRRAGEQIGRSVDDRPKARRVQRGPDGSGVTAQLARVREHRGWWGGDLGEPESRRLERFQQRAGRPPLGRHGETQPTAKRILDCDWSAVGGRIGIPRAQPVRPVHRRHPPAPSHDARGRA
jgi:hypothetical protein